MRLLLQRATRAEVRVDGAVVGRIGAGLVALVGIGPGDTEETVRQAGDKMVALRIFRDAAGLTNRSLIDVGGEVLAISQFTLYADTRRGRRPSFLGAAAPDVAERLFATFTAHVAELGITVARGIFGSEMEVELINDGPMTIWLDSDAPTEAR